MLAPGRLTSSSINLLGPGEGIKVMCQIMALSGILGHRYLTVLHYPHKVPGMIDNQSTSNEQPGDGVSQATSEQTRTRSKIVFPYGSLRDAEQIAETLHSQWGGEASPDQLAGSLNSTPRSGTFRIKVASARIFGVVNVSRGKVSLTELGHKIVDPQTQESARVEAFLFVPLFREVFEEYKGKALPPDGGLEQKITDLGVSAKQKDKARQTLQRSAERAGFFKTQKGRLIRPATNGDTGPAQQTGDGDDRVTPVAQGQGAVPLPDLWITLLDQGRSWPAEKTHQFVKAARDLREIMSGDG